MATKQTKGTAKKTSKKQEEELSSIVIEQEVENNETVEQEEVTTEPEVATEVETETPGETESTEGTENPDNGPENPETEPDPEDPDVIEAEAGRGLLINDNLPSQIIPGSPDDPYEVIVKQEPTVITVEPIRLKEDLRGAIAATPVYKAAL